MAKKTQGDGAAAAEIAPDDDVEVIIVDDEVAAGDVFAQEGVDSLKEQLEAQRKRADDAERRAVERDADAKRATAESARNQSDLEDSRLQTIQNAIAVAESKRKDVRNRLVAAKTVGDFEAEADLSLEVAQIATELQRMNEGKNVLENRIANEREAAKNPQLPDNPVERAIALTPNLTPRAATWLRTHPETITDPVRNAELVLADKRAQREGIDPASNAYFAHMDRAMGYADDDEESVPVQRRQAAPAAPVSRGGSIDAPLQPGQIRLTRAEREMADAWGWSYKKYHENKMLVAAETGTKN